MDMIYINKLIININKKMKIIYIINSIDNIDTMINDIYIFEIIFSFMKNNENKNTINSLFSERT